MIYKPLFSINTCVVLFFRMFPINEATIKWEIKTKPLEIGKEARLSCNDNNCPSHNTRRWLGGKNYDLLCFDGESKNPSKYNMTSNGTTFDLMIKNFNFTDVNCEYTCTCGFQQYTKMLKVDAEDIIYPPRLQKNSVTQKDGKLHVDALIKVHPSPNCSLLFKEKVLQAHISVRKMSEEGDLTLYEVAIEHTVEPGGRSAKGTITLNCKVGSNAYSLLLYKPDSVDDEDKPKPAINFMIGSVTGIVLITVFVALTYIIIGRSGKTREKSNKSATGKYDRCISCMVLTKSKDNTSRGPLMRDTVL